MNWRNRVGVAMLAAGLIAIPGCELSVGDTSIGLKPLRDDGRLTSAGSRNMRGTVKASKPEVVSAETEADHREVEHAAAKSIVVDQVAHGRRGAGNVQFEGAPAAVSPKAGDDRHHVHLASGPRIGSQGIFGQVDSHRIATTAPAEGPDNLWQITFTAEGGDFDPAVDADGKWLVYASTRHRETADLFLKRVNGTTITQLTNDPSNDVTPAFSPDGQRIAFASDRSGSFNIYIMDVEGGQPVQITNDGTHDIHPTFSRDGRRLVYSRFGSSSGQWEMVLIDLENPGTRRIIGTGLFPQWSPVDDRIVFQRPRQRGTRWFSVWTVTLNEDGEVSSPTEIASSANAAVISPRWSPDGEHIVFCTVIDPSADNEERPAQADIWVVGADGRGRAKLTSGQFANLQPTWAADGTVYFVSNRAGEMTENIWAVRPDRALHLARPGRDTPGDPSARVPTE